MQQIQNLNLRARWLHSWVASESATLRCGFGSIGVKGFSSLQALAHLLISWLWTRLRWETKLSFLWQRHAREEALRVPACAQGAGASLRCRTACAGLASGGWCRLSLQADRYHRRSTRSGCFGCFFSCPSQDASWPTLYTRNERQGVRKTMPSFSSVALTSSPRNPEPFFFPLSRETLKFLCVSL